MINPNVVLSADGVSMDFPARDRAIGVLGRRRVHAVRNVSVALRAGTATAVVGESGAGSCSQHRESRPSPNSKSGGASLAQDSRAWGHLGWKEHPSGRSIRFGDSPLAVLCTRQSSELASVYGSGVAERRSFVYGWVASAVSSPERAASTTSPAYITTIVREKYAADGRS